MRARLLLALAAISLLLYNIRDHISQLGEVARTYATFYSLLRQHPELLYRYPTDRQDTTTPPTILGDDAAQDTLTTAAAAAASNATRIPRIMHQIALGSANMSKYADAMATCRAMHPDWEFMLWTDGNASDFIADNYPWALPHYTRYPQQIQRANILRYAVLHAMGGVYLDLDVACLGHAFLEHLIEAVPRYDMFWGLPMRVPYVENMLSTGCMFFSNRWMSFVRMLASTSLADATGDMAAHMLRGKVTTPLFAHGGASSWHSWDAALIILIGKHYIIFGALITALLSAAAASVACLEGGEEVKRRQGELGLTTPPR
ncbi:hypothetical protein ACCO45_007832 [Purpureocillium lilacinum]|uniref:Uncharacterized protein n=1 Tax=Purpureocillium lilacinum TaxID=33203 RepID=A0ACC4DP23_PURLI